MGDTCTPMADSCQCMAKPLQYSKVISLQLKLTKLKKKKEATCGGWARHDIVKTHNTGEISNKQEDNHNCRGSSQRVMSPSPTQSSQTLCGLRSFTRKVSPQTLGFEGYASLQIGKLEGLRKQTLSGLKGCVQNFTLSQTKYRSRNLKGNWIRSNF